MKARQRRPVITSDFTEYLELREPDPTGEEARRRIIRVLLNRAALPSFSASTSRLFRMCQDPRTDVDDLAAVIALDPALSLRCLRAAASVRFGARQIHSIQDAIFATGMRNLLQIAMTAGLMEKMRHLSTSVDWRRFWFHSVLVARLSEQIATAFAVPNGTGYLAGLLHDIGKVLIQQNFPAAFEEIISHAIAIQASHHVAEAQVIGLDHAQIGAAMCELIGVPRPMVVAVRYHHEPLCAACVADRDTMSGLLPAIIAVANATAKLGQAGFESSEPARPLEELPEYHHLAHFERRSEIMLDVVSDLAYTEADLDALLPGRN